MSKMLFVKSNDYWGYDASQFDDTVNFYRFTWVVPEAMYKTLDSDDQSSLNPCALFYVQGVTDNHNFLTLKIAQDGDEAKVSGMQGTKRRTRRYNIGSPAQYSVGSYALQEAPAGATSVEAIKTAVESGSTSEGSFNVSEFLTEASDIAAAVNMVTEDKSAETFAAPSEVPSGSAYEPADPTVANPATEGYSESDLVTMDEFSAMEYTPEIGGYPGLPVIPDSYGENSAGEGFGVPVWYGSAETSEKTMDCDRCGAVDSSVGWVDEELTHKLCEPCDEDFIFEQSYEAEGLAFETAGTLSYKTSFTRRITGDQKINQDYKVSYEVISGNEQYSELTNEHRLTFRNMIEKDIGEQIDKEGLVDITREEYLNGEIEYTGNNGQEVSIFYEATLMPSKVKSETISDDDTEVLYEDFLDFDAEGDSRLRDIRGKFMNRRKAKDAVFGEVMSQQMSGYYRTGIVGDNPPVGQNIARRNPAAKARYFIEPGVQNPNSGEWSKGPNFQQARKIAKGVAWDTVQDMGLAAENASFGAMPSFTEDPAYLNHKTNDFERTDVTGAVMYRGKLMPCMWCGDKSRMIFGSRSDPMFVCESRECHNSIGIKNNTFDGMSPLQLNSAENFGSETAYAELGNQEFPVVPNSEGGNTALDSGYGVPQWYGSAEYEAQSITETLEEAAPVSLKKPVLVAAVSALTGFLIARRRS